MTLVELCPWLLSAVFAALAVIQARRAVRTRTAILDAAHELARPLAALRLGIATLGGDRPVDSGALDGEAERAGSALEDLRLIADGRPQQSGEAFDPAALVSEIARLWSTAAEAQGRSVAVSALQSASVKADRVRIGQAITNLVANSLEHGAGTVRLAVTKAGGSCRIEVTDDGPGSGGSGPMPSGSNRGRGLRIASGSVSRSGGRLIADCGSAIELPLADAR
jgi:signal transduction histidine kinase